jgi:hypothetical protein
MIKAINSAQCIGIYVPHSKIYIFKIFKLRSTTEQMPALVLNLEQHSMKKLYMFLGLLEFFLIQTLARFKWANVCRDADFCKQPGWPDWADFRLLGNSLPRAVDLKVFGYFFHGKSDGLILTKNVLGYILGEFYKKLIWSPCKQHSSFAETCFCLFAGPRTHHRNLKSFHQNFTS